MAKEEKIIMKKWMDEIPKMKINETAIIPDEKYDYVLGSVKQRLMRTKNICIKGKGDPKFFINGKKYSRIIRVKE